MTENEVRQTCIDLSTAAVKLFDILDAQGVSAPLEKMDALRLLKEVVEKAEGLRYYYLGRSAQLLLGLDVNLADLLKRTDR